MAEFVQRAAIIKFQGAERGNAGASGEAAERAQIELDHKGPNMHRGPLILSTQLSYSVCTKGKIIM